MRRIATQLYAPAPNGEPGNDDLGAMSSWYVWAAIGMYPETPGRADLVLASPLFSQVTVRLAGGRSIVIDAPRASTTNRYVEQLDVDGMQRPRQCVNATHYVCPWLPPRSWRAGRTPLHPQRHPEPALGCRADRRTALHHGPIALR